MPDKAMPDINMLYERRASRVWYTPKFDEREILDIVSCLSRQYHAELLSMTDIK